MLVRFHHDPRDFFELVEPFLLEREVENGLPLGIARTFVDQATHDGLMFSVESGTDVVAVAVKSPKRNLVITAAPEPALRALANYLHTYAFPVPGINAPMETALDFARAWIEVSGTTMTERVRLRIFELRALIDGLPAPAGAFRLATMEDAELIERWLRAFIDEATHDSHEGVRDVVARRLGASHVGLWADAEGIPMSMAATTRRSARGSTIAWVYTPPELRSRGYATACVAELSRRELAAGRSFCTLYTDQSNPTSNKIYQRIGYLPVCDALDATFH
jgi:GNAT superfamily N-acetyltransferase